MPNELELKDYSWRIRDQDGYIRFMGDLPHVSGERGNVSDKNVTVSWFDNDNNGKLSLNDSFYIQTLNYNLTGYRFKFGKQYEDGFDTRSNIDLK